MIKNVESISLINKNILAAVTNPAVAEVKELRAQILELKAEIKKAKYISWENRKQPQNNEGNRKPPYKGLNWKPVDKKNLECYKCEKKGHFKLEYWLKPKNWIDYRNIQFLKTE